MAELRHGVRTTYAVHGCRCDLCKASEREAKRRYRQTETGRESMRRSQRHAQSMRRAALRWIKENEPDVYRAIRREVYSD
jgi:sugar (pentulose or hexulose) kinase